jgi:hypothetical protein
LRAEGFFCNLDVLGKLQFLIKKFFIIFFSCNFFQFLVIKALDPDWIRIGIQPKMLDPDPDEMNADPQPCLQGRRLGEQGLQAPVRQQGQRFLPLLLHLTHNIVL